MSYKKLLGVLTAATIIFSSMSVVSAETTEPVQEEQIDPTVLNQQVLPSNATENSTSSVQPTGVWVTKYIEIKKIYDPGDTIPYSIYYVTYDGFRGDLIFKDYEFKNGYMVVTYGGTVGKYV